MYGPWFWIMIFVSLDALVVNNLYGLWFECEIRIVSDCECEFV
jgi:hypothetical protein